MKLLTALLEEEETYEVIFHPQKRSQPKHRVEVQTYKPIGWGVFKSYGSGSTLDEALGKALANRLSAHGIPLPKVAE